MLYNKLICPTLQEISHLKVEYHANENPLKILKKIGYVGQRLMHPIIKKQ